MYVNNDARSLLLSIVAMMLAVCGAAAAPAKAPADLAAGFRNPPASAKPHTWWHWMNGNVTKEGITADLEAMKRVGIGGAWVFHVDQGIPKGPVSHMSPAYLEMMKHAATVANKLGLELAMHNCAGWSSSGGPWITPPYAMQRLTLSEKNVHGPTSFDEVLPQPPTREGYYRDVAVLAFPTLPTQARISNIQAKAAFTRADGIQPDVSPTPPGAAIPRDRIINLTADLHDGRLTCFVPEGDWTILRIGYTPTGQRNAPAPPEGTGLECDKLSREALRVHWNGMVAKVLADVGPLAGRTLDNVLIDSYEMGSQNWTPKFREEFIKRRGYDPLPFLPVITGRVVDSIEASERFLWDFRRTIADLYADNYYGYFAELCHKSGLMASAEPYGNGPFDNIQSGGTVDIPMGEFWIGGAAMGTLKLAASIAHTYGRPVVGAESFTADENAGRWQIDPYAMKAVGDQAFCEGINRYIFHRYAHQPWMNLKPGMTMGPWGTHFERTTTWWDESPSWLRYVARCQYLLQSGRFHADVLFYAGEGAPSDMPDRMGLPSGYDFDVCDTKVLRSASVRNGRITLPDGMSYRLLVLPNTRFMTPELLHKVAELVRAGATVVGPKPDRSPSLANYPACDEEVRRLANELWGDIDGSSVTEHRVGQGRIFWGRPLAEVLTQIGLQPDFSLPEDRAGALRISWIHRTVNGADVYFVSNQARMVVSAECSFRVAGKAPELWYPDTGVIRDAPVYRVAGARTTVPIRFDPAGSVFVVFRKPANDRHLVAVRRSGEQEAQPAGPRIAVQRAYYGPSSGAGGADVTARVAGMVASGQYAIPATNSIFGDPTPDVVKQLTVEYTLNGKPMKQTVAENDTLELAQPPSDVAFPEYEVIASNGRAAILPWRAGSFEVTDARGATRRIDVREDARKLTVDGPWSLRFPRGWGAPSRVSLSHLISWTEHSNPGVRYFSGTAEYETTLNVPAEMVARGRVVVLDLGRVKNLAAVIVNGRRLDVLWKPPFRVDLTGMLKPGVNSLKVQVTNLWPNRLIGDEQLPPDAEWNGRTLVRWPSWLTQGTPRPKTGRYTFTTWRYYTKDSPLLESGLLGPVTLRSVRPVAVP